MTDERSQPSTEADYEADQHRYHADLVADLFAHIAEIEAGYTLPKPWKVNDTDAQTAENIREIRSMLARWEAHGIKVANLSTPAPDERSRLDEIEAQVIAIEARGKKP